VEQAQYKNKVQYCGLFFKPSSVSFIGEEKNGVVEKKKNTVKPN